MPVLLGPVYVGADATSVRQMALVTSAVSVRPGLSRSKSKASSAGRDARRASVGLAPDPQTTAEPVVQVYAARAVRWRGYFGVHTWVAVKRRDAKEFTVYEVNGWRLRRTGQRGQRRSSAAGRSLVWQSAGRWSQIGAATASMSSLRASKRQSPPIRTRMSIASGPGRTRTRSWRTCCALRRNCAPICRRRRSARITSAPASSRARRAAPAHSSTCSAWSAPWPAWKRASSSTCSG